MFRNQFLKLQLLNNSICEGRFGFPTIPATDVIPKRIIAFNKAITYPIEDRKNVYVHFFIDDYQFERIWNNPERYLLLLTQYAGIIQPTFSIYTNMPLCTQLINVYRNQTLASYYSNNGINVIPVPAFCKEESFDWCFEIIPHNSVIAMSTISNKDKELYSSAYCEIKRRLKPKAIIVYGPILNCMKEDKCIIHFQNFYEILQTKQKGAKI